MLHGPSYLQIDGQHMDINTRVKYDGYQMIKSEYIIRPISFPWGRRVWGRFDGVQQDHLICLDGN